ncbi:MAG: hypothetical protein JSW41_03065 [Candidatus Aenigmatarchaeota archaeon]|nr:MAG: hypothetical protein JSW41_03065 [Candidatus Aenigmarchaeota archaeon]
MKELRMKGDAPMKSAHVRGSESILKIFRMVGQNLTITHEGVRITLMAKGPYLHYFVSIDL